MVSKGPWPQGGITWQGHLHPSRQGLGQEGPEGEKIWAQADTSGRLSLPPSETRAPGSQLLEALSRVPQGTHCRQDDCLVLKGPCFLSENNRNNDVPQIPTPPHFLVAAKGGY